MAYVVYKTRDAIANNSIYYGVLLAKMDVSQINNDFASSFTNKA